MKRCPQNPIITRKDIPEIPPHLVDVTSVFNPGAIRFDNRYLLMLRVQNRGRETCLMTATGTNGVTFTINPEPVRFEGLDNLPETVYHVYDPRLTCLEGRYYIMVAMDTDAGCRLGLARTDDFRTYRFMGFVSGNDVRNGVLFPEKIGGRYLRLDRPNRVNLEGGSSSGDAICLSASDDLVNWETTATVMTGRRHFWDELIGSGPPPVKTRRGWLHIYHGIATHFAAANIYQAGVVLLDLVDPAKVIARSRYNILEPREPYEQVGQVPNVVFPGGMIVDRYDSDGFAEDDSRVLVYYGAADTCVAAAETSVGDLLAACFEGNDREH